jgi:hypothetical protein
MATIPATPATGLERDLLDAYPALTDAADSYARAMARYQALAAAVKAQDNEGTRS